MRPCIGVMEKTVLAAPAPRSSGRAVTISGVRCGNGSKAATRNLSRLEISGKRHCDPQGITWKQRKTAERPGRVDASLPAAVPVVIKPASQTRRQAGFSCATWWLLVSQKKSVIQSPPQDQCPNIDQPVCSTSISSARVPSLLLPILSRPGDHTAIDALLGAMARMPPPTPLLPGKPTR